MPSSLSSLIQAICEQLGSLIPAPFNGVVVQVCEAIQSALAGLGL